MFTVTGTLLTGNEEGGTFTPTRVDMGVGIEPATGATVGPEDAPPGVATTATGVTCGASVTAGVTPGATVVTGGTATTAVGVEVGASAGSDTATVGATIRFSVVCVGVSGIAEGD